MKFVRFAALLLAALAWGTRAQAADTSASLESAA
jgi:hypothetical protein